MLYQCSPVFGREADTTWRCYAFAVSYLAYVAKCISVDLLLKPKFWTLQIVYQVVLFYWSTGESFLELWLSVGQGFIPHFLRWVASWLHLIWNLVLLSYGTFASHLHVLSFSFKNRCLFGSRSETVLGICTVEYSYLLFR